MKNQPLRVERMLHAQNPNFSRCLQICVIAMMLAVGAAQRATAQQYYHNDLSQYVHGVAIGSGGPWSSGDTVPVTFSLGDANAPVQHLAGVQLKFTLETGVGVPATGAVTVNGSWCFDPATVSISASASGQPLELNATVMHPSGSCTGGYGELLTIHVIAASDDPKIENLVEGVGGLVIIENVDARMGASPGGEAGAMDVLQDPATDPARTALSAASAPWPNPTRGLLHLPGTTAAADVRMVPAAGGAWSAALPLQSAANGAAVDLSALPQGCYLLRVAEPGVAVRYCRVLRE